MKLIDVVKLSLLCERIFFFDFEIHCDGFNTGFEVYYCVVNVVCKLCMNEVFDSHGSDVCRCCRNCVEIFSADDCMDRFSEHMLEMSGKCRSVWVAHNGACFDALFILRWFLTKSSIVPNVVMNGKYHSIG